MEGYYDPHPVVRLERPLALIGFFGGFQRQVAHRLAARTGLTFIDLDRWVEHAAGRSMGELVYREGEERLREIESQMLQRAVRSRPPGILALGDGALLAPLSQETVVQRATLVYLKQDLAGLYWRLRAQSEQAEPHAREPLLPWPLESIDQLRAPFQTRLPGFRRAHLDFAVDGLHPEEVCRLLLGRLPELGASPLPESSS